MTKVLNKAKKWCGGILTAVVVILILLAVFASIISRKTNRPTFLFGYSVLWVETGSMEPEIPERSYILVKRSDGREIENGSVITFVCSDNTSAVYGSLITHRVIDRTDDGYKTQGDNSSPDTWTVYEEDVVSVYLRGLPVLTACGRIFASPIGLMLIFAVFLGSCVFLYIPDIIKAVGGDEKAEREKEKIIAERVKEEVRKLREKDRSGDNK